MLPTKQEILNCEHGISSYYYKINEKIGVKFFNNKNERDDSKIFQKSAYYAGLAPNVYESIYHEGFWGYYTDNVEMLHKKYSWQNMPRKIHKQIDKLGEELYNACNFDVDYNWKNFGYLDNKLVCVDFGYVDNYAYCS